MCSGVAAVCACFLCRLLGPSLRLSGITMPIVRFTLATAGVSTVGRLYWAPGFEVVFTSVVIDRGLRFFALSCGFINRSIHTHTQMG